MTSFKCCFLYSPNEITGSHLGFFSIPSRLPHKENCQWWGLRFFRDVDDLLKSWHTKGDVLGWYTSIMESVEGHLSSRFTKGLSCQGSYHFTWFDLKNITIKQQLNLRSKPKICRVLQSYKQHYLHEHNSQGLYPFELFKFHDFPRLFPCNFQVFCDHRFSFHFWKFFKTFLVLR